MTQPAEKKPLHVLSLQVENILRVSAVYIEPSGKLIEITGKNFQGKSSTLEALWMAFGGDKAVPEDPIHDGGSQGVIVVQLGDHDGVSLKITKTIKKREDKSIATSLIVENAEGHRLEKPQQILNSLIGQYTSDPLEFLRSPPKAQFDAMKAFVPGVDFAAIDIANASDFSKRTDVNRRAKDLRAQSGGIVLPQQVPSEPTDETALVSEMEKAGEHNTEIERQKSRRQNAGAAIDGYRKMAMDKVTQAEKLVVQASDLTKQARADEETAKNIENDVAAWPQLTEPVDASAVRARIERARADNTVYAKVVQKQDLIADAEIAEAEAAELTAAIAQRESDKQTAVATAKMPVKGISFGDGAILLNGYPLGNASGAQQLRVAVEVAAALNPRLRFVRIKDASLLDPDSWKELAVLCDELNLQVFAETVASGRAGAVVIEDGYVAGAAKPTGAAA